MQLQLATREQVKLRLSIGAPAGFGKTAGALILAHGMGYDWGKIGVIDSENKSASLYANHTLPNGYHIGAFQTIQLEPPYTPEKYSQAIKVCEDAGMEVVIIDSVTHVWTGKGGLLESNDSLGGNKFQNWAKTTPRYQAWLSSILNSKCHVITTNRKKQAYELSKDASGKTTVEKKGMEDQIRDGYDYEMTIAFEIINDGHLAKASKDRSSLFSERPEFVITEEIGKEIMQWCESGLDPVVLAQEAQNKLIEQATKELQACINLPQVQVVWNSLPADVKPLVLAIKDEMKLKLTPAVALATQGEGATIVTPG